MNQQSGRLFPAVTADKRRTHRLAIKIGELAINLVKLGCDSTHCTDGYRSS